MLPVLMYPSLAIGRIFGGFPQSFYETYQKYQPKSEPVSQYSMRGELYGLYHYLNHTLLFGASHQIISLKHCSNLPHRAGMPVVHKKLWTGCFQRLQLCEV